MRTNARLMQEGVMIFGKDGSIISGHAVQTFASSELTAEQSAAHAQQGGDSSAIPKEALVPVQGTP